jgi:hypothetical protein
LNPKDPIALIGFSDSAIVADLAALSLSKKRPENSDFLYFDGRRFNRKKASIYRGNNLVRRINFISGGNILFTQEDTLGLGISNGWIWGTIPKDLKTIGLHPSPVLKIVYKTASTTSLSLQLQKTFENFTKPEELLDPPILQMDLPSSPRLWRTVRVPLPFKNANLEQTREIDVFVLADPNGEIEISEIKFDTAEKKETSQK